MTAPSFDAEVRAWLATGAPLLDNAGDGTVDDDPDPVPCDDCRELVAWTSRRGLCNECDELAEQAATTNFEDTP